MASAFPHPGCCGRLTSAISGLETAGVGPVWRGPLHRMVGRDADRSTSGPGNTHTLHRARWVLPRVLLQIFVDECDRHAALTDRGGNALDRAQPHIPTGESV